MSVRRMMGQHPALSNPILLMVKMSSLYVEKKPLLEDDILKLILSMIFLNNNFKHWMTEALDLRILGGTF